MNSIQEMWRRLLFFLRRGREEQDLAEEMRLHLDLRAAERLGEGDALPDAEAAARRRFGNVTQLRETSRETWSWHWLDSLSQDVRYGIRTLSANPAFTLTAVLSLALGIGANTAIFTILNALMLRSLPVEDPHRLVELRTGDGDNSYTNPIWEAVRDHQQAFSGSLAFSSDGFDLADGGERQPANGLYVSGDFFRVLGVSPLRGRMLTTEDDQHGGGKSGPVAVVSYSFWQARFGGAADVIGRTIKLDRHPFQIVGVTPPWFTGLETDHGFDVAIPIGCESIIHTDLSALGHRSWWWLRILGRLSPDTTIQQAEARMISIAPEVNRATLPADWEQRDKQEYLRRTFRLKPAATGFSETGRRYRTALFTLMAVVGLVLLIACANIANLLLARATARQREISIRLAIGAGRWRIVRQLLTESLILSLLGATAGLLFARWGSAVLVHLLSSDRNRLDFDLSPDLSVLAFTMGISIVTGILFGLAPAFRATRFSPNQTLKEKARGAIVGASRFQLGKALVAGQVALSLVLLVGAGLFLGTMRNLLTADAGFDSNNVLLVRANLLSKVPKPQRLETRRAILERFRSLPQVTSASSSFVTPVSGMAWDQFTYPEGFQAKSREDTLMFLNRVSAGYFRTMKTPILMGHDFSDNETPNSPRTMILNASAAQHFFGNANPVGKTVGLDVMGKPGEKELYQVIGVVKDARYSDMTEKPQRIGYLSMAQDPNPDSQINFEIRSAGTLDSLTANVRSAIADASPGISIEFRTFDEQIRDSLLQPRMLALLSTFFGALALLLAMVGLYGVTNYSVLRRQGEIGIRMALGAARSSVIALVLRDVLVMLVIGTFLGLIVSVATGRLVESLLYGVKPADVATILTAALVLAAATALAGYLPARRASRLDPMAALRDE